VQPAEIEDKLVALGQGLKDVAVTCHDEQLHALIQPVPGLLDDDPARQIEHFRWQLLEPYNREVSAAKKITRLSIVGDDLPKTRLGKLKRHELPALVCEAGTPRPDSAAPPAEALGPAYAALARFLREDLDCRVVRPDSHWEMDLGLDSLALVSVLVFIEKTFGVRLPEDVFAEQPSVLALARHADANRLFFHEHAGDQQGLLDHSADGRLELPRSTWLHPFLASVLGTLARLFFRLSVHGRAHLPARGPCILAVNHQSYLDGLFVSTCLDAGFLRQTYYYAKAKHVKGPLAWLAERSNVIVVEAGRDVGPSLRKLALALSQGGSLMIFPEGTRARDGSLGEFKPTFARLALELGVPVIPVVISGAWRALPRHGLPRPLTRVTVEFLPAIGESERGDVEHLNDATRSAIARHLT